MKWILTLTNIKTGKKEELGTYDNLVQANKACKTLAEENDMWKRYDLICSTERIK